MQRSGAGWEGARAPPLAIISAAGAPGRTHRPVRTTVSRKVHDMPHLTRRHPALSVLAVLTALAWPLLARAAVPAGAAAEIISHVGARPDVGLKTLAGNNGLL